VGPCTVGIDIGTTSVKAVAADERGDVVARCRIPHALVAPTPDRFEHDPAEAWSAGVLDAWHRVSTERQIAAVTVAAMVPSMCGVDGDGRPVPPGLLYGDRRGATGGPRAGGAGVDGEAAGFARWLSATTGAAHLWPAQAVANHALAGVGSIDTTTAMTMLPLFDGTGWSADACAAIGVDPSQLPGLSPGTAPVGEVGGALVNGGTVDVFAEQLVADARVPGDVLVLCGTTLITWVLTEGWPEVDRLWTVPYTVPGLAAVGGASNAGGLFVDAVRRLLAPAADDELGRLDPGAVPVWLPYLRGERTPLHDADRRGELLGFALGHGPAAVLRAAYEASAFVVRHHVELSGRPAHRLVAVGGGTRSAPWMQALADVTGLPVDVSAVPEGAALGAAYLARVTAGLEPDTSGSARWARVGHRVEPRPPWAEAAGPRYARFLEGTRR
jgi:xylulokinase